jgi:hypothetical protein
VGMLVTERPEGRVTPIEAAELLGVSTGEVYRLVLDKVLDGRIGTDGDIWVSSESLVRYQAASAASA